MIRAVNEWIIRKRDGRKVPFESKLIFKAICNAFRAELNLASGQPLDGDIEREVGAITEDVVQEVAGDAGTDRGVGVEQIQDMVEMQLMKRGHYRVARRYIVYRAEHAKIRSLRQPEALGWLQCDSHRAVRQQWILLPQQQSKNCRQIGRAHV